MELRSKTIKYPYSRIDQLDYIGVLRLMTYSDPKTNSETRIIIRFKKVAPRGKKNELNKVLAAGLSIAKWAKAEVAKYIQEDAELAILEVQRHMKDLTLNELSEEGVLKIDIKQALARLKAKKEGDQNKVSRMPTIYEEWQKRKETVQVDTCSHMGQAPIT